MDRVIRPPPLPPASLLSVKGQVKEGGGGAGGGGSAYREKTSQNMVIRCEVQR